MSDFLFRLLPARLFAQSLFGVAGFFLTDNNKQSGASSWSTSKRQQFANDITRPQLWAVTGRVNNAKSDSSPDKWKPPLTSFYCTYAKSWVQVKSYWQLTVTSAEKTALTSMLNTC